MNDIDDDWLLNAAVHDEASPKICGSSVGMLVLLLGCTISDPHPATLFFGCRRRVALSGYVRSPTRCGFYNELGTVDEGRLAGLIPQGQVSFIVEDVSRVCCR